MLIVHTHDSDLRMTNALAPHVERIDAPDWAIVCGDRHEMAVEALRLHYEGYKLIHVGGGDTPHGTDSHPDHRTRDAISMLAQVHCVANEYAARNLINLGIPLADIHVTGSPGLDEVVRWKHDWTENQRQANSNITLNLKHTQALVHIHPHPSDHERSLAWLEEAKRVAREHTPRSSPYAPLWIAPNTDDGGKLKELTRNLWGQHGWERLKPSSYLAEVAACTLFVTNSSAGLLEAPILDTPVSLVGERQAGRCRSRYHHPDGRACVTIAEILREMIR